MAANLEVPLEIAVRANGRFVVQPVGAGSAEEALGEFASLAEAESWLLRRSMAASERAFDTDILKPGDGQGLI